MKYEINLSEKEYKRLRAMAILVRRILDVYDKHPEIEITIKTKPKKWWQWVKR